MKKVILIIIIVLLVLAVGIVCAIKLVPSLNADRQSDEEDLNKSEETAEVSILEFKTAEEVKEYADSKNLMYYEDSNLLTVYYADVFNDIFDIEYELNESNIYGIYITSTIFDTTADSEDDAKTEEYDTYQFSENEKKRIEAAIYEKKTAFEEYLGCGIIENYDLVPTTNDVSITAESSGDLFYFGEAIREYSVKDKNGNLWLLRFSASDGYAYVDIFKITDLSDYDGFIPSVDMTK